MNDLEMQLHYPLGEALAPSGGTLEVAPGVRWIRMTLPFALNHINLWLLRDCVDGVEGWSIVDCCIHRDEAKAQWESIFAHELQGLPILRVIVTHMHPDHIGLAHWLCERWSGRGAGPPQGAPSPLGGQRSSEDASVGAHRECRLWISATDYQVARLGCLGPTGFGGDRAAEYFAAHGLNSPEAVEQIKGRTGYFPSLVPSVPPQYRRLMDGMVLDIGGRGWRCISGYGHAPEHIALYCAELNVLIGGDMMLPRISTNVSVYEQEPESNALVQFLDSIDKFRALPEDTLVLPSHGKPFTGMHTRIQQLHDHHRDRLAEVMEACTERPCCAFDILPVLFKRPLDMHQTTFAMGEAVAHLHALWFAGQLQRTTDAQGVYRFGLASA
ncbi:MBL fold metallo-hydrolase [Rhodoferax sp. AJA081-3]|uniref:MBL fold metallo-hydrolase n=1 Tax=Rhodoferax sp. AJA081-3 TaxID=2752316 RepID=UPI001ADFDADC|nr:MBL fold metallo-hydrolase [Rhodoferax sp. AJA081-3]QTN30212.1 MBL fold metallo-hydrolase [Rhodoferax sp. AJA081-3]